MTDEQRITALAKGLLEDWQRDQTSERTVTRDDAYAIAGGLHHEMEQLTQTRAELAAEQGLTIACQDGCSHCCASLVMVFNGEAVAIAEWLSEPDNEQTREWFLEAYPRWLAQVGEAPEQARDAQRTGADERYVEATMKVWKEGVMCAFNRDDRCTVYPVRPSTCRNCHALDTSDRCQASHGQPARKLRFQSIEDFRFALRPLSQAMHVALGGESDILSPLCQQVYYFLNYQGD